MKKNPKSGHYEELLLKMAMFDMYKILSDRENKKLPPFVRATKAFAKYLEKKSSAE